MINEDRVRAVLAQYASVARSSLTNESAAVRAVAEAFGYSAEDLASLPPQANMGLSCGNPIALAGLRPGEVVLDLGCGGGLDVVLAARRVGPLGRVIGIDMTREMIDRARASAVQASLENVEFHVANIDRLPLPDTSIDCVISNCVINLVPDKAAVFRDILRVLKPGGRVAISDIALRKPLPVEVANSLQAYVGCIAGAIQIDHYARLLRDAGFDSVVVSETGADLNAYAQAGAGGCRTAGDSEPSGNDEASLVSLDTRQPLHDQLATLLQQFDANEYAASVHIHAVKAPTAFEPHIHPKEPVMKTVQIFDRPMCCSTGVCGPSVDPVLPRFAADLAWLKSQGHQVDRYNLAQQPMAFTQHAAIRQLLTDQGIDCLPIMLVDGRIVSRGEYPSRDQLANWVCATEPAAALPLARSGSCCQDGNCC